MRLIEEAAVALGEATVCLVNLLNPELVVLGGGVVTALGRRLLDTVTRVVRERALAAAVNSLRLELSGLQEEHWAIGGSLLVADEAMERIFSAKAHAAEKGRRRRVAGFPPA